MSDAVTPTTPLLGTVPSRRTWTLPQLSELPKLTKLTLASAIGGGGGTGGGGSTVFGAFLAVGMLLGLGACAAEDTTGPRNGLPEPVKMQAVTCQATVATKVVTCQTPQLAGGREILGGQGSYVVLRSSNITSSAGVFTADVTVQNLSAQPLGTDDGINATGLYVFFVSGPTVTGGTGNVSVANADGIDNFSAPGQAYFDYNAILGGLDESAPKTWEWAYDVGVTDFVFTVLVAADVPELGGVLRWSPVEAMTQFSLGVVAANSTTDVIALGDGTQIYRKTGSTWASQSSPFQGHVGAVAPLGAGSYVAVVSDWPDSRVAQYSGGLWHTLRAIAGVDLSVITAGGSNEIVVGGWDDGAGAGFLSRFDGTVWKDTTFLGLAGIRTIGGSGAGQLTAATYDGDLIRWNGAVWVIERPAPASDAQIETILALSASDIYLGGSIYRGGFSNEAFVAHYDGADVDTLFIGGEGVVQSLHPLPGGHLLAQVVEFAGFSSIPLIQEWDGANWTTIDTLPGFFSPMVSADGAGYFLLGEAGVYSWDGGVSPEFTGTPNVAEYNAIAAVDDSVYIANEAGQVLTYDGSSWSAAVVSGDRLEALWAFTSTDIYAAGPEGMFHFDGAVWSQLPLSDVGDDVRTMWGTGTTLFAAKTDTVFVLSGGVWTPHTDARISDYFRAIWGTSATDVYFVGYPYTLTRFNGTTWSDVPLAARAPGDSSFQLTAIRGTSSSDIWIGTDYSLVLHYDGVTSTDHNVDEISTVGGILPTGPDQAMVCGDGVYLGTIVGLRPVSHPGVRCDVGLVKTSDGRLWALGSRSLHVATR